MRKIITWFLDMFSKLLKRYKNLYSNKPWYSRILTAFASFIFLTIVFFISVDINLFWLFGKSPTLREIKRPTTIEASQLYSADGVLIGKYFSENRTPVSYSEVNPSFWKALIDTEDERFYKHKGVDIIGVFAALKDAFVNNDARGASTITQQLAKNMFHVRTKYSTGLLGKIPGLNIAIIKAKEWIIALKLEFCYSKEEILAMYANTVDFGSNAYGIKTASKTYFNTTPDKLKTDQSAVLVGMLKATTTYNPILNPEKSRQRRNIVLNNMVHHGDLSREAYDTLQVKKITLDFEVEKNYDGQAQYFREAVAKELEPWCKEHGYDLYASGLKIYTTLDSKMQNYAEQAATKQMKIVQQNFNSHWGKEEPWQDEQHHVIPNFIEDIAKKSSYYKILESKYHNQPDSIDYYMNLPHTVPVFDYEKGIVEKQLSTMDSIRYMVSFMHCAMVAMEPQTGHIKAWVGDIDFNSWKYDKVQANRQPGSTFKLFVYTEAMNQGLTPCDKRRDEYIAMEVYNSKKGIYERWTPSNADGHFTGDSIPLKSAFARSINSIAVRLGQEVGIDNIIQTARQMGIESPLEDTPSLTLGSNDVTLEELTSSYCTVANNGIHVKPVLVTRIEDHNGKLIYQAEDTSEKAISRKSAFLVQQLLLGGLREPGATSMNLWGYIGDVHDTDFGGKTGTSNNHSDAWFMAVSPRLVVGAWVGGEYRCIHFRTGQLGQGSRTALPICGQFLHEVFHDPAFAGYHGKFSIPEDDGISPYMYLCESYYRQEPNDSTEVDSLTLGTDIPIATEEEIISALPEEEE